MTMMEIVKQELRAHYGGSYSEHAAEDIVRRCREKIVEMLYSAFHQEKGVAGLDNDLMDFCSLEDKKKRGNVIERFERVKQAKKIMEQIERLKIDALRLIE